MTLDPTQLPADLPRPVDDGAADHLRGAVMPALALPSTAGGPMRVDTVPTGFRRLIVYAYPLTGLPGVENPAGWDGIPGARGCTPETCGFRDHAAELAGLGAAVAGLSTQSSGYQREAASRLRLPFPLLSDAGLELTRALKLPVFTVDVRPEHDGGGRQTLIRRLTLVISDGVIEKVFYPIFPPDRHADEVLDWLRDAGGR
ncbi:MAG TPA: peroxiredoxin [Streptosporangiaceae bacterium]|jgi:peroxiredoxin